MLKYDVVVVGAGPSGCMAAKYAAKEGASVLLVEEDSEIGEPVQCAGLVSERAIEESEIVSKSNSFVQYQAKGAIVHSLSSHLRIEAPNKRAFAIRRGIFDKLLAEEAIKTGVDILLRSKVVSIEKKEAKSVLKVVPVSVNGKKEIESNVIIGADGVKSRVAKMTKLNISNNRNLLSCAQIEGKYETLEGFVEVFIGKTVAPGFFMWAIPLNEDIARIGLCIDCADAFSKNALLLLKNNLERHSIISKKYKGSVLDFITGAIPIGLQKSIDTRKGVLLVGDAAAQVKPVTGGGIYYGIKCGKIAGETAAKAAFSKNTGVLKEYEKRWRRHLAKEIAFGLKVHRLRRKLSDKDFDAIFRLLAQQDMSQLIKKEGDMDYPSILFHILLKNPLIIKLGIKNLTKYLYKK